MFAPQASFVINLDRRADRLRAFYKELPPCVPIPERVAAVDGWATAPADHSHKPAYGCLRSHLNIFRKCIDEKIDSVLIFEDDAIAAEQCCERFKKFSGELPDDWQFVYLGGTPTLAMALNRVSPLVMVPRKMRATHAYALRQPMLGDIYDRITQTGYHGHIDHWYESYFGRDGRPGYYCPNRWLFYQRAGNSDISGSVYTWLLCTDHPEDVKNAKFVVRPQPCDQDPSGRCRRKRCGQVRAIECLVGNGLMKVEI